VRRAAGRTYEASALARTPSHRLRVGPPAVFAGQGLQHRQTAAGGPLEPQDGRGEALGPIVPWSSLAMNVNAPSTMALPTALAAISTMQPGKVMLLLVLYSLPLPAATISS
jgi:hypothetical protein